MKLDGVMQKIEDGTNKVINVIWKVEATNKYASMTSVNQLFNNFVDDPKDKANQQALKDVFGDITHFRNPLNWLNNNIKDLAKSVSTHEKDCRPLVDLETNITSLLIKPYMAYQIGCELTQM